MSASWRTTHRADRRNRVHRTAFAAPTAEARLSRAGIVAPFERRSVGFRERRSRRSRPAPKHDGRTH